MIEKKFQFTFFSEKGKHNEYDMFRKVQDKHPCDYFPKKHKSNIHLHRDKVKYFLLAEKRVRLY